MKNISALQKAEGTEGTGGTTLIVKDNISSLAEGTTGNRGNRVDYKGIRDSDVQGGPGDNDAIPLIVNDAQGSPDTEGTEGTTGNYDDQEADEPEIDHTVPMEARPMYVTYDQPAPPYKRSGLWYHGISQKGDNPPEPVDTWICSPIYTEAQTHGTDGSNHGLLLRFKASSGSWKKWAAPMHLLKGAGDELRGELLDRGLRIDPKARMKLTDWLMAAYPKDHLTATAAVGWHGASFVMPDRIIGKDPLTFQNESAVDPFDQAGTISGWRNEVGKRLAVSAADIN